MVTVIVHDGENERTINTGVFRLLGNVEPRMSRLNITGYVFVIFWHCFVNKFCALRRLISLAVCQSIFRIFHLNLQIVMINVIYSNGIQGPVFQSDSIVENEPLLCDFKNVLLVKCIMRMYVLNFGICTLLACCDVSIKDIDYE